MLITGNAAFALAWGVGGIAGPPSAGALMNLLGAQGLPLALGLLCGVLVAWLSIARSRAGRDPA